MMDIVVRVIDLHIVRREQQEFRYLVMHRAPGQQYAGIWQGVTGKIESAEKAWQAALRELREETGLTPVNLWTVDRVNFFYAHEADQMNSIPVFGVEVGQAEVVLSPEHDSYRWCTIEVAADLILWEQQRLGLLAFHDMLTVSTDKLPWLQIDLGDDS